MLYHATTPRKAKSYHDSGCIHGPVRGFDTFIGALAWACKVGRTVIYEFDAAEAHKLPDHHNQWGEAYWCDTVPISSLKCVFSAEKDA